MREFQNLIVDCSQLDAGTDEKLMLVARDEQSCLVVSYKDVKMCMEGAFRYVACKLRGVDASADFQSVISRKLQSPPMLHINIGS